MIGSDIDDVVEGWDKSSLARGDLFTGATVATVMIVQIAAGTTDVRQGIM